MSKLAVIILTRNEEANIEAAMESVAFADEIVVVDSGSTDRTRELAEKHGAKFVTHPMDEEGFAGQRNFALTQTEAEWVFYLDADERLIPDVKPKILSIVREGSEIAYRLERKNVVFGQMMRYGVHKPDYVCRLCPRKKVVWQGRVHERVTTDLPIKKIDNALLHYTYESWEHYFYKYNQYTSLAAKEMASRGKKVSSIAVIGHSLGAFLRSYVLNQGFRDGFMGGIMSFMAMAYTMTKYMKLKNIYRLRKKGTEYVIDK